MEFAGIAIILIISVVLTIVKLKGGSKTHHSEEEHTQEEIIRQRQTAIRQSEQNNEMASMRSFDNTRARQTAFQDIKQKDEVRGAKSLGHHQSHCDVNNHSFNDRYRVEKVPVMNSIGGKSTEGCQEHYDVRFVKEDREEKPRGLQLNELQKAMVFGEILNNPAFKRNGYRKMR